MSLWDVHGGTGFFKIRGPMGRGVHDGADFLAKVMTPHMTHMLKQSVPGGLHPVEGTHTGAVQEELQLIGKVCGGQSYG